MSEKVRRIKEILQTQEPKSITGKLPGDPKDKVKWGKDLGGMVVTMPKTRICSTKPLKDPLDKRVYPYGKLTPEEIKELTEAGIKAHSPKNCRWEEMRGSPCVRCRIGFDGMFADENFEKKNEAAEVYTVRKQLGL